MGQLCERTLLLGRSRSVACGCSDHVPRFSHGGKAAFLAAHALIDHVAALFQGGRIGGARVALGLKHDHFCPHQVLGADANRAVAATVKLVLDLPAVLPVDGSVSGDREG